MAADVPRFISILTLTINLILAVNGVSARSGIQKRNTDHASQNQSAAGADLDLGAVHKCAKGTAVGRAFVAVSRGRVTCVPVGLHIACATALMASTGVVSLQFP